MPRRHSKAAGGRATVLEHVKREGPVTAEALAAQLGITGMAVRQHLERLEQTGLVDRTARTGGRGRPSNLWRATEKAESHFADSHAALALDLIAQTRKAFGQDGLNRLIALRTEDQEQSYAAQLAAKKRLKSRLETLARIRSDEGYMAEVRKDVSGAWLLLENHCPICPAARACAGLCQEELGLFQRVLGKDVRVERVSHILAGAGRCTYRVTPV